MKKRRITNSLIITIILVLFILSPLKVNAGKAGVGVLNVPPQYSMIRLVQQDNNIRIYLTVSDYNSWEDIDHVSIVLEDSGVEKTKFIFKQYQDKESYVKINEFTEISNDKYFLVNKKCSYDHSDSEETVEDRCNLEMLFVFENTWFTRININASDREGLSATLQLDYSTADIKRSGDIIIIPGLNNPMSIELPPYLLDIIALFTAIIGTWYFVKKTDIIKISRAIYEKN